MDCGFLEASKDYCCSRVGFSVGYSDWFLPEVFEPAQPRSAWSLPRGLLASVVPPSSSTSLLSVFCSETISFKSAIDEKSIQPARCAD